MAYRDPAKKRAKAREHYEANKPLYQERHQQWKAANPERFKESRKKSVSANRDARNQKQRERYRTDEEYRKRKRIRNRNSSLKRFGLTPNDYQDVLDEQGGGCAICGKTARVTTLAVDHDHKTGQVRGILCRRCNSALGLFNDDPEMLKEAARYLLRLSSGVTSMMSNAPANWPWTTLAFRIRHSMEPSL